MHFDDFDDFFLSVATTVSTMTASANASAIDNLNNLGWGRATTAAWPATAAATASRATDKTGLGTADQSENTNEYLRRKE